MSKARQAMLTWDLVEKSSIGVGYDPTSSQASGTIVCMSDEALGNVEGLTSMGRPSRFQA